MELAGETFYDRRESGLDIKIQNQQVRPTPDGYLDLVRMHIEFLRQLDQCLLALDRGHRRFRLECRAMVPARSSSHGLLLAGSIMLRLRGKST